MNWDAVLSQELRVPSKAEDENCSDRFATQSMQQTFCAFKLGNFTKTASLSTFIPPFLTISRGTVVPLK